MLTRVKIFEARIQTNYKYDNAFSATNFHAMASGMAVLNGMDEWKIDRRLFCSCTSHWHTKDVYPPEFCDELRQILLNLHDQYSWLDSNMDHPVTELIGRSTQSKETSQAIRSMWHKHFLTLKKQKWNLTVDSVGLSSLLKTGETKTNKQQIKNIIMLDNTPSVSY